MQSTVRATIRLKGSHQLPHSPEPERGSGDEAVPNGKYAALLSPVIRNRPLTVLVVSAAVLQTGLAAGGLPAWSCPIRAVFSTPCPACGLTSGAVLLLQGNWGAALQAHLLSPMLAAALVLAACSVLMPKPIHRRLVARLEALEKRTGVTTWLGILVGTLWIWQMVGGI